VYPVVTLVERLRSRRPNPGDAFCACGPVWALPLLLPVRPACRLPVRPTCRPSASGCARRAWLLPRRPHSPPHPHRSRGLRDGDACARPRRFQRACRRCCHRCCRPKLPARSQAKLRSSEETNSSAAAVPHRRLGPVGAFVPVRAVLTRPLLRDRALRMPMPCLCRRSPREPLG